MTQGEALDILKSGMNVYLTGSAGAGKTYVLNQYIEYLKAREIEVAVTASTGIAATHMNGTTIHSWSGLGIRDELTDWDMDALEQKKNLFSRFQKTKVLIIDEVSMLHAHRLDMVNRVCQMFKRSSEPFGGIQIVLSGDFFQLPPITRNEGFNRKVHYIYASEAWKCMDLKICYLEEQHRQEDDAYSRILNAIRDNEINEEVVEVLKERHEAELEEDVVPTKLYTHNVDVDAINTRELAAIEDDEHVFTMMHKGKPHLVEGLMKSCLAPADLRLKRGAAVMFVKNNYEAGYVNGTLGKVIKFDEVGNPVVETIKGNRITAVPTDWSVEDDGKILAQVSQVPLRLAWAITVHKSQGMSLDAAEIDLSKSFVQGQGYVALSRVRSLKGLRLVGFNPMALQIDPAVLHLDKDLRRRSEEIREIFEKLTEEELEFLHTNFVKRMGGIADDKKIAQNIESHRQGIKEGKILKVSTYEQTKELLLKKLSLKEIAKERGMTEGTIISHLEKLKETDPELDFSYLKPDEKRFKEIKKAFDKSKDTKLTPVVQILGAGYSFDEVRLARVFLK